MPFKALSAIAMALMLAGCSVAMASPDYSKLSSAIHRIENGTFEMGTGKGEQYGIHSVHYKDALEARLICIRTCRNYFRKWQKVKGISYHAYLAQHYCPKNHVVWLRNLNWALDKQRGLECH